jgi:hypothetical protein
MPYRDNRMAIDARRAELERELAELKPRVNDLAYLKWKQKELETALADLETPSAPKRDYGKIALMSGVVVLAILTSSAVAIHKLGPASYTRGVQCGRDVCCGLGCPEDGSMRIDPPVAAPPPPNPFVTAPPSRQTPHMADRSGPPLPLHQPPQISYDPVK